MRSPFLKLMPFVTRFQKLGAALRQACLAAIPILGIFWVLDLPVYLSIQITNDQFVLTMAALAVAAGYLQPAPGKTTRALDLAFAISGSACWFWSAWNYDRWLLDIADRGPAKWAPGALALLLLLGVVRRHCGTAIAVTMGVIGAYGFLGHHAPGVFQAAYTEPRRLILYLYADSNGVPGLVLSTAATVVLAFIFFSKALEVGGAAKFFDDFAMAILGRYRGGPAKVAVASSALFGIISGSSVANVVSSGIVTIPLMKRHGYAAPYAAAVEAVSSNAGQITPPVMGAAAFLIAEFLQIPYSQVGVAAIIPAIILYLALIVQVDCYAARRRLTGLTTGDLPAWNQLRSGWVFALPIGYLVYLMFWQGYNAGKAAVLSGGIMLALGCIKDRKAPNWKLLESLTVGAGRDLVQILLVSAAAGIVVGVLNISGLSFSITLMLSAVAQHAGSLAVLMTTALLAIVLGMGMPTAAVYVLLSVVLAPTLIDLGIAPLAAHLFIFYFGLLSMLTPPVAMASFSAASIAGSDMWSTSWIALKMGAAGYVLPFLFALNPALIGNGSISQVVLAFLLAGASAVLLAFAVEGSVGARVVRNWSRVVLVLGSAALSLLCVYV